LCHALAFSSQQPQRGRKEEAEAEEEEKEGKKQEEEGEKQQEEEEEEEEVVEPGQHDSPSTFLRFHLCLCIRTEVKRGPCF